MTRSQSGCLDVDEAGEAPAVQSTAWRGNRLVALGPAPGAAAAAATVDIVAAGGGGDDEDDAKVAAGSASDPEECFALLLLWGASAAAAPSRASLPPVSGLSAGSRRS
mmetsp:Transcript_153688/g.491459  ORF Transcript_153688/g.491459 Transcript_153688/m.491459 type:complete len:108 (-) Transcript_153688:44-367(-)